MWAVEICNISSIIKIITEEIRPRVSQIVSSPLFLKLEMCPLMVGQGRNLPGEGYCSAGAPADAERERRRMSPRRRMGGLSGEADMVGPDWLMYDNVRCQ